MPPTSARPSDRFIPYYIAGFFIALMAAMGWFISLAMHNYSGEVIGHPYREGLRYNQTIEAAQAQEKLGWKSALDFTTQGLEVKVTFRLTDKSGKAITGADAKVWFLRPTIAGHDQEITLTDNGKGTYSGAATLAWPGDWEVHVSATADGNNYQQVKELNLE